MMTMKLVQRGLKLSLLLKRKAIKIGKPKATAKRRKRLRRGRRLRKRTRAFKLKPLMGVLMMKMTLWKRIDQSHPRAYFF